MTSGLRGAYTFIIYKILEDEYLPLPRAKAGKRRAEAIQKDYDKQVAQEIRKYPF
jgi:hypothetical protein